NIAPQVVFEILSPSNTAREMLLKQQFYEQYGVLELFFYDPASNDFWGLIRSKAEEPFQPLVALQLPWTSPLLGIRFERGESELEIFYPNGEKFKDPAEFADERDQIAQERDQLAQERDQLAQERQRAFAKLRELGIDPNTL
ncbi:MAG: Uma2 family endonuclease, partial [Prochlorothrix sp.]|nr:Uma2 family endonuclease [Prochlorothrix sp.]